MHRNPATGTNSHGTNFTGIIAFYIYPNACFPFATRGRNAKISKCSNDTLLQQTQIFMDIGKKTIQIQNGIANQLPGAVIGNIPSSIRGIKRNAFFSKGFCIYEQIIFITTFSKRIHMRMLHKKQMIFGSHLRIWISAVVNFLVYGALKQFLLQIGYGIVCRQAQFTHLHNRFKVHNKKVYSK
ncbi:MAG: Uncharacterised protein [Bacteroidota bacterium]|nr:MAG: Uncharacterised protein [Bacteroidota bacterium]